MTSFEKSVKKIFEDIFQVKKSESILILCDKKTKIFAEKVYMYSTVYGKKVLCFEVPALKHQFFGEFLSSDIDSWNWIRKWFVIFQIYFERVIISF